MAGPAGRPPVVLLGRDVVRRTDPVVGVDEMESKKAAAPGPRRVEQCTRLDLVLQHIGISEEAAIRHGDGAELLQRLAATSVPAAEVPRIDAVDLCKRIEAPTLVVVLG